MEQLFMEQKDEELWVMCRSWQRRLFSLVLCEWDKAYNDQFDNKNSAVSLFPARFDEHVFL